MKMCGAYLFLSQTISLCILFSLSIYILHKLWCWLVNKCKQKCFCAHNKIYIYVCIYSVRGAFPFPSLFVSFTYVTFSLSLFLQVCRYIEKCVKSPAIKERWPHARVAFVDITPVYRCIFFFTTFF